MSVIDVDAMPDCDNSQVFCGEACGSGVVLVYELRNAMRRHAFLAPWSHLLCVSLSRFGAVGAAMKRKR